MILVIDTETTGDGPEDQVIELGAVGPREAGAWLFRPTVPISPVARGVHHITDEELAPYPTWPDYLGRVGVKFWGSATVVAAHNLEFDERMLRQSGVTQFPPGRICTWRCSLRTWPEAPGHGVQALRYWLGLEVELGQGGHMLPHRALYDALVCEALLARLLEEHSAEDLQRITEAPMVLEVVRFGKHRGARWEDVPPDYLRWMLRQGVGPDGFGRDERHTAQFYLGLV